MNRLQAQLPAAPYNIPYPTENVFAFGFSTGGLFSYRLGCELTNRFNGIAVVGAAWNWAFSPTTPRPAWTDQCTQSVNTWSGIGTVDSFTTSDTALTEWREYSTSVLKCDADSEVAEAMITGVTCR